MKANHLQPQKELSAVLFILLLGMMVMAKADPVDFNTAKEVGLKFMDANVKTPLRGINDLQLVTTYNITRGDAAFYIFNIPNGFVIVAADDCATPILGYSEEGHFDVENIPIQLQGYLQGFVEQIEYGIENHLEADERIARQWVLVRRIGRLNENRDGEVVEPLVTALWSQRCYYNNMCPEDPDGPCGHVLTGCVATAMGMILHYWGYPAHGTGSHTYTPMPYPTTQYPAQSVNFSETTYDWANMPDQLTETSTQTEIDAVSTLLWHCGVAVDMNYSPYGSGMEGHFTALMDYFDYSDDMHWETRQDDESWMSLLKADLDLGRPIFYTGYRWANSGHAFVCDGYDVNDRFHFNWGWGSSNGYFALDATMSFVYDNDAIFNIHPNVGVTHQVTALVSPSDGGSVSGAGIYDIGDICTLTATACEDYMFMCWTENGEVVSTQAEYSFCVRKDRDLVAHFGPSFQSRPVNLVSGWNWFSANVEITMDDLKAALVDALPGTNIIIKSMTQNAAYHPGINQWRGTLASLDLTQMYMIHASTDCVIMLEGMLVNPTEHSVTITNGTNWIAFPLNESISLSDAFAGFATTGDLIKGRNSTSNNVGDNWKGTLNTLEPGQGYMYISNTQETRTFTFPIIAK